jgi:hypothetical protein
MYREREPSLIISGNSRIMKITLLCILFLYFIPASYVITVLKRLQCVGGNLLKCVLELRD